MFYPGGAFVKRVDELRRAGLPANPHRNPGNYCAGGRSPL